MTIDIRALSPDEYATVARLDMLAFAETHSEALQSVIRETFVFERSRAAVDDGQAVALSGVIPLRVTLPGQKTLPAAGISWVAVLPTHRRRGLLRRMMAALLEDARQRAEPLAVLTASESSIYGRFGFGVATDKIFWELACDRAAFSSHQSTDERFTLHEGARLLEVLPVIYAPIASQRPGAVSRSNEWWRVYLQYQRDAHKGGRGPLAATYTSPNGRVEGYVLYHIDPKWEQGLPASTLVVDDLVAATPTAYAALWHYCLHVDLVRTVSATNRPLDEPLRWLMVEPRQLRVTRMLDDLWVCLLDIPTVLAARHYTVSGSLVIEVHPMDEASKHGGQQRYRLDGGPDGAFCVPTTATADLVLSQAALGSVYLGAPRWGSLSEAGVVCEQTPGALTMASAMFTCSPQPWSGTSF